MLNEDANIKKWAAVLDHESAAPIQDNYRRSVTAKLLENSEAAQRQQLSESNFGSCPHHTHAQCQSASTFGIIRHFHRSIIQASLSTRKKLPPTTKCVV